MAAKSFFPRQLVSVVPWHGCGRAKVASQDSAAKLVADGKAEILTLGTMHLKAIQMNPCYDWPEPTQLELSA